MAATQPRLHSLNICWLGIPDFCWLIILVLCWLDILNHLQARPQPFAQRGWHALSWRGRQLQLNEAGHAPQHCQVFGNKLQLRIAAEQQQPQGGGGAEGGRHAGEAVFPEVQLPQACTSGHGGSS